MPIAILYIYVWVRVWDARGGDGFIFASSSSCMFFARAENARFFYILYLTQNPRELLILPCSCNIYRELMVYVIYNIGHLNLVLELIDISLLFLCIYKCVLQHSLYEINMCVCVFFVLIYCEENCGYMLCTLI